MNRLLSAVFIASRLSPAVAQMFQQTLVTCPKAPETMGYNSISAMNEDMMRELAAIGGGKTPEQTYTFIICPKTDLDAGNATLTPLLDGATFLCGENGSRSNSCRVTGGATQVTIDQSLLDTYPINTVGFMGITFTGFTGAGIAGGATSNTTVSLQEVDFIVRQTFAAFDFGKGIVRSSNFRPFFPLFRAMTLCLLCSSKIVLTSLST